MYSLPPVSDPLGCLSETYSLLVTKVVFLQLLYNNLSHISF